MIRKLVGWLLRLVAVVLVGSVLWVVAYTFVPPPLTPLMVIRVVEGLISGNPVWIHKDWVALEDISPNLQKAVIASEDARFFTHGGIDWDAVKEAQRRNERAAERAAKRGKKPKLYGASTITMQTAKNAFLPPTRNYVRKAFEAYFTYLIEFMWGKHRILEVYLNIIEMGNGIYGAEAASQRYFGKPAARLSQYEAALLAAILPDPRRRSLAKPTAYLQRRAAMIQARMVGVALPKE